MALPAGRGARPQRPRGLLGDLLTHRATEVAVVWRRPSAGVLLDAYGDPDPLVRHGRPSRLVVELSALTGALAT